MTEDFNFVPRLWQVKAGRICRDRLVNDKIDRALVYACPGAGKTFGALHVARELIDVAGVAPFLVILTPSLSIRDQWIEAGRLMGIELMEVKEPGQLKQDMLPFGIRGIVMTYQAAIFMRNALKLFCDIYNPVCILDEVHHTATSRGELDGNAWGTTVAYACRAASFKLCMTGTPFRQGNQPIAFVQYTDSIAVASVEYPYSQAIKDGVCRVIEFEIYDGEVSWSSRRTKTPVTASFKDQLNKKLSSERLEAALQTDGKFPFNLLMGANERLMEIRTRGTLLADARAGGLAVGMSIEHANQIADVLKDITGVRPPVIHSKLDAAHDMIAEFREGDAPWVVSINMLSEGVDIKRLRVGAYCTKIRESLYFQQFCGRFSRVMHDRSERSYIFMPGDPRLEDNAIEIEMEKYHALGEESELLRRGGDGMGRGRRPESLEVNGSSSDVTAVAVNGQMFTKDFITLNREKIRDFRERGNENFGMSDAQVLRMLICAGTVTPPMNNEASR